MPATRGPCWRPSARSTTRRADAELVAERARRGTSDRWTDRSFVAVGDVMLDVSRGRQGHAARIEVQAGGSAVNAAVWAAAPGPTRPSSVTSVTTRAVAPSGRARRATASDAELSDDPEHATGTFLVVDGEIRADRGANAGSSQCTSRPSSTADACLLSGYVPSRDGGGRGRAAGGDVGCTRAGFSMPSTRQRGCRARERDGGAPPHRPGAEAAARASATLSTRVRDARCGRAVAVLGRPARDERGRAGRHGGGSGAGAMPCRGLSPAGGARARWTPPRLASESACRARRDGCSRGAP
jgi:hypothetical protein